MGPFPPKRRAGHAFARPKRLAAVVAFASLAATLAARPPAALSAAPGFKVIAHPSLSGQKVKRSDLAAVYMRKVGRWGDGRSALPVDQPASADVRKRFSEEVLRLNVVLASQYWLKQMTAGGSGRRLPPIVKSTDVEVVAYVKDNPGAVGYVSPDFPLGDNVKLVEIVE